MHLFAGFLIKWKEDVMLKLRLNIEGYIQAPGMQLFLEAAPDRVHDMRFSKSTLVPQPYTWSMRMGGFEHFHQELFIREYSRLAI